MANTQGSGSSWDFGGGSSSSSNPDDRWNKPLTKEQRAAYNNWLKNTDSKGAWKPGSGPSSSGGSTGGSGGGYYGSSGGGGGGGASSNKAYVNYYTRILGIKPNMSLVKKAVSGNYTMQEFQLLVQRNDTNRYLRTAQGQQAVSNFRTLWARIFPSLGSQPGMSALKAYLKQKPSGNAMKVTNPTSIRDMYAFLAKTKKFKSVYGDFAGTQFERTLDFDGYRRYKDQFQNIMSQYTGQKAADEQVSLFFKSDITPDTFERNLTTVLGGKDAYAWAAGQQVGAKEQTNAMYGLKGGMQTLQKIAEALETRQNYMGAKQAQFGLRQGETGRIEQSIYG